VRSSAAALLTSFFEHSHGSRNPINRINPNNPFNPINEVNPENPFNPLNRYNPNTPFAPLNRPYGADR
jgi:hypothetical protein